MYAKTTTTVVMGSTDSEVSKSYIWDGQNIVAEANAHGVFARYYRGINLIARQIDANMEYYHFNAHGDVVQRTDSQGGVLKSYDYDAFGNDIETTKTGDMGSAGTVDTNPFRYCAEYWDSETGTYYLRARHFNPTIGRFTSEDSVRSTTYKMPNGIEVIDPLSLNLYTYCYNNPIMHVDPSGHDPSFYVTYGKHGGQTWHFLMDSKPLNVMISLYGFVPFLDNAIWGATDLFTGNKTVTQDMYQDIATKIGASLGVASNAASIAKVGGAAGKLAKFAGWISTAITAVNIGYEAFDNRPYYHEITGKLFRGYYESRTFELTSEKFLLYSAITEDLVKQGIITYKTSWGMLDNYKVDWEKYNAYFEELGMTAKEIGQLLK